MTEQARRLWDAWADDYQDAADIHVTLQWGIDGPKEADIGLLGALDGRDVLVMGCGGGQGTVWAAERGANALGVDLSAEQLSFARSLADDRGAPAEFAQGDVTDLGFLADESRDVVVSAYALQWVPDLAAAFAEAHRVLRPGGRFVCSMPHPMYEITSADSREVVASYFDTGRDEKGEYDGIEMATYRHRVSDVFEMLRGAGFRVDRLLEPGSSDPGDYETDAFGFDPDLMADVPPSVVFAADKPA